MKRVKAILALLLVLAMVFALAACAKEDGTPEKSSSSPSASAAPSAPTDDSGEDAGTEEFPAYSIGFTIHGAGVWIIDLCTLNAQHFIKDVLGFEFQSVAANFSSEQMVKDVQNLVQTGQDAHMYTNTWSTIMESVSQILEEAQMPWVNFDQPIGKDMIDVARENPYFVGTVTSSPYDAGYLVGSQAAEDGYKSAVLIGGAIGDTVVDARLQGFTDAFEAGGGKVIAQARCSDPSEASQKGDDLIAAYGDQIDCFFGQNADFVLPVIKAVEYYGYEAYPYTAEPDAECLDMIRNGEMSANTPTGALASTLGSALLVNTLDGHQLLNEDGIVPYIDTISVWMVTPDTADLYQKYVIDGYAIAEDDYKNLLYRYNPDIDYESFADFVASCGYDYIAARG